jgi:ribonucleotide reductase alpha subunit
MSQVSEEVLKERYYLPGESSWEDVCKRVSNFIGCTNEERKEFYDLMASKKFIPNSPCLFNAGTKDPIMSACFAIGIDDDMVSIYDALKKSALLFKAGAGVGFNFSNIRPRGAPVGDTNGVASGVLSFMSVFNESIDVVKQAGRRRGASIAILNDDHPEIEDFIRSKVVEGKFKNFNISVLVSDAFLKAVEEDKSWDLKFGGKVYKTLPARELFGLMVSSTYKLGEPGYLFRDTINASNPNIHLGEIVTTNPCVTGHTLLITKDGNKRIDELVDKEVEIWNGYEWSLVTPKVTGENRPIMRIRFSTNNREHYLNCTLYHTFHTTDGKKEAKDLVIGDTLIPYRLPDNDEVVILSKVVNIKLYQGTVEKVYCLTEPKNHTFIANGILVGNCGEIPILTDPKTGGGESCNLGSIDVSKCLKAGGFDLVEIEYVTRKAAVFLNEVLHKNVYPFPEIGSMTLASAKLGYGQMGLADAFIRLGIAYDSPEARLLAYNIQKFIDDTMIDESQKLVSRYGVYPAWKGSTWDKKGIKIANSVLTCNAPTGTISLIAECSSGIEPNFSFVHQRKNCIGKEYFIVTPIFEEYAKKEIAEKFADHGEQEKRWNELVQYCYENGSIQGVDWISPNFKRLFKTNLDIDVRDHIDMQAVLQEHTGNSISKTCIMKKSAKLEEMEDAVLYAWKKKVKGLTLYRQGSREDEVINLKKEELIPSKRKVNGHKQFEDPVTGELRYLPKRPDVIPGLTAKKQSGCNKLMITVNEFEAVPYEVLVGSKKGGCKAMQDAMALLASLCLRWNIPAIEVCNAIKDVECNVAMRNPNAEGKSCPNIIAKFLESCLPDDENTDEVEKVLKSKKNKHPSSKQKDARPKCPSCGEFLDFGEGCRKGSCACGWSGCN